MADFSAITRQIEQATGKVFSLQSAKPLSGGDINAAYRLQGKEQAYFVKLNRRDLIAMFQAESKGLEELARSKTLRIPQPVTYGQTSTHAFLVLEYIALGSGTRQSEQQFGEQLARLHQQQQPYFGWHCNNTIGSSKQINTKNNHWLDFWCQQRLRVQLELAAQHGYQGKLQHDGEILCNYTHLLFQNYQPQASLLHGDLWQGNVAYDPQGQAVIFDPACYYGDREADIAMTELFGGFSQNFYAAYHSLWPLDPGYAVRKKLYNLYHILNHLNLFGSGYLGQAEQMLAQLLAEIK